jgi:hypothetical protein
MSGEREKAFQFEATGLEWHHISGAKRPFLFEQEHTPGPGGLGLGATQKMVPDFLRNRFIQNQHVCY